MIDIQVKLIDMDPMIKEQVVLNSDDSYTIFINSRLTYEAQYKSYYHALHHIYNDDLYKDLDADLNQIETLAHALN